MIEIFNVHEALKHFVDSYWEIKSLQDDKVFLPDGCIHLIINLGDPITIDNGEKITTLNDFCMLGPQHNSVVLSKVQDCHIVGAKFKLGKFTSFFNVSAYNLLNQVYIPNSHYKLEVNYLREFMKVDNHIIGILAYFDRFLLRNLSVHSSPELLDSALKIFESGDYSLLIKDLCAEIGVSNKHLIKIFKDNVGLPPKSLYRIKKFQKAIYEIDSDPAINWSDLVDKCHYFDQAHLINEFKFFSGMTPTNYCKIVQAKELLAS